MNASPLNSALLNKISPSPLTPQLMTPKAPIQMPKQSGSTAVTNPFGVAVAHADTTQPTKPPVSQNSNPQPNINQQALSGLVSTASGIQTTLARMAEEEKAAKDAAASAPSQAPQPLFSQFLNKGQQNLEEAAKVGGEVGDLRKQLSTSKQNIMGNRNYSGSVRLGQAGIAEQNIGTQIQGLAAEQQALQGQGQANITAAGVAAPVQVPYSNQYIDPTTGQPVGGGSSGGSLQGAVSDISQRIKSGSMSYSQGLQALGSYGQAGVNALLQSLGPNFNTAQSDVLAGQQGSIVPAYNFAQKALQNLQSITETLGKGFLQGTNIPGVNSIGNWISHNFGVNSEQTRQYHGAVQEARNAYAQLLAASKGGTPSEYTNQAITAIPDDPTPNDIKAAFSNLESLGKAKVDIYGNPGGQSQNTSGSNSSVFAEQW